MDWQALITALLVAGCSGWAAWNLMPAALRRSLASKAGRPLPAATGCGGCDGCGGARPAAQGEAGVSVIRIVRQPPR